MLKSVLLIAALLVADTSAVKITSDPICSSAGCDQYKHKGRALGYDLDYKVPNFGEDTDISDTKNSLKVSEEQNDHKWVFGTAATKKKWHNKALDTLYNFQPRYEDDI